MLKNTKEILKGVGIFLLANTIFGIGVSLIASLLPVLIPLGVMAAFYHLFLKH